MLALWSFGLVLAVACGTMWVARVLAKRKRCAFAMMRQRLREWDWEAHAKQGAQRQNDRLRMSERFRTRRVSRDAAESR